MDFKYNYIIAGGSGFYEFAYSDLFNMPNVVYFRNYIDGINSKIKRLLLRVNFNLKVSNVEKITSAILPLASNILYAPLPFRLFSNLFSVTMLALLLRISSKIAQKCRCKIAELILSTLLNKLIRTPLGKLVYPWLFPHSFKENRPLCFIFFGTQFAVINTSYLNYLRKKYPNAKLVLYMQDIIASLPYYDIESYKKRFDLVLSYDKGDCERYNLEYYPTPFSKIDIAKLPEVDEDIDVYFCGAGKTRYPEIFKAYIRCKNQELKCKFFLMGVPLDKRIDGEGLVYDKRISYEMNLAYAAKSKCILEIMQENADGYTPRLWEAIMLK